MIVEARKEQEYSLEQLLERVTRKNLHAEVDSGTPAGKEIW
jgi:antitoxin component of MazEF toxin-antitoxin module